MSDKPQGKSGPVAIRAKGLEWVLTTLPGNKAEREQLVANLFVKSLDSWVAGESEPSLRPFGVPLQNNENDLDFTVSTSIGDVLMELAEFAPLAEHGPNFEAAPLTLESQEKAKLATALVAKKSAHQGGADRILLLYVTEYGFWLDPCSIECMRRALAVAPPKFDRVYYLSIHSLTEASTSEIYPGKPHHHFGTLSEAQLAVIKVQTPHPASVAVNGGIVRIGHDDVQAI